MIIDAVEPFERRGGGSCFRDNGDELCKIGVEGLLPIFAQDAVAGSADPSSLSSSLTFDFSPGAGQSDKEEVAEWYEGTVAGFGLGVRDELEDCESNGGRPRTDGLCEYGSKGPICSCK